MCKLIGVPRCCYGVPNVQECRWQVTELRGGSIILPTFQWLTGIGEARHAEQWRLAQRASHIRTDCFRHSRFRVRFYLASTCRRFAHGRAPTLVYTYCACEGIYLYSLCRRLKLDETTCWFAVTGRCYIFVLSHYCLPCRGTLRRCIYWYGKVVPR